jgi:mono/diheme cytochrome c family protein
MRTVSNSFGFGSLLTALILVLPVLPARIAGAANPAEKINPAEAVVDYERQVKPILTQRCVSCHGEVNPKGGLRLDTARAAIRGGQSGPSVVPGDAEASELIAAVKGEGATDRMPLKRPPLTEQEIQILEAWVRQGAAAPEAEVASRGPSTTHWAFVPPERPVLPGIAARQDQGDSGRTPIDAFIVARLAREGLSLSPEADRATLLRRVSLDLIGLPPTPQELDDFLADNRPDAYERVVDRLLASPHFGERWARPWLDQARYADSNGFNIDAPRSIWKYRDWVIDALNRDVSFRNFVIDQIAGDLVPGADTPQLIATGFHRNTPINQEGGIDLEQFRIESIVDRVQTTGSVFLGLTIGCAQCHDHKYDPITQREYYQFFAFFNNADEPEMEITTPEGLAARKEVQAEVEAFHRDLVSRLPDLEAREAAWEATLNLEFKQVQADHIRIIFDVPRDRRSESQRRAMVELMIRHHPDFHDESARLQSIRAKDPQFITTLVVRERSNEPRPTFIHLGGDFTRHGDRVSPGIPQVLSASGNVSTSESVSEKLDTNETQRLTRLDLARWLVDRKNPLTARVTVNRIWQVYFGRGLVETENDFGTQGSPPSHPELLDWLACEFMESDWKLKTIHRTIVTSAVYRQSSQARSDLAAVDPENKWYGRQSRLRLDAELIRDSALASSGLLTRSVGGPSVFPPQPDGVMTLGQMKREWKADTGPNRFRRGLYTYLWRATPHPFFTVFDAPGGVQSCTRRLRSNTPLQALTLLNDPGYVEIAKGLADRLVRESADSDRITDAFRLCLGRKPSTREIEAIQRLLDEEKADANRTGASPSEIETRSWTTVARVLLNLDEFMTRE